MQSKEIKEFLGSRIHLTLTYNKLDMSFYPKKIRTFEIHRKGIDMKAWVKEKFKDGEYLELINYSELLNDRFTLVKQYSVGVPFQRHIQATEIKGEIVENRLIYSIQLSIAPQLSLSFYFVIGIIFSIGLFEEANYLAVMAIWVFFIIILFGTRLLLKSEIKHLEKLLEEEMRFI